jgi:hypothetical protein
MFPAAKLDLKEKPRRGKSDGVRERELSTVLEKERDREEFGGDTVYRLGLGF